MAANPAGVRALRARLAARELHPWRSVDGDELSWEVSPAGTDASLGRFLVARKGDLAKAEEMFAAHLVWRRRAFPIPREGAVAKILEDGQRFSRVGANHDGMPVLLVNFLWGYFLEGFTAFECLSATLRFMEEEIATSEKIGQTQAYILSTGGPPPMDYLGALVASLEANYPERLARAAIYPVPRVAARLARAMCWILDANTASKVAVHWSETEFTAFFRMDASQLPPNVQGGLEGAERQFAPDSKARMNRLLRIGLTGGTSASVALQAKLLKPLEALPAKRRAPEPVVNKKRLQLPIPAQGQWLCCCGGREVDFMPTPKAELSPASFSPCAPGSPHTEAPEDEFMSQSFKALELWSLGRMHVVFASTSTVLVALLLVLLRLDSMQEVRGALLGSGQG